MGQTAVPSFLALSDDLTGTFGLSILIANENIPVRALTHLDQSYDPAVDAGKAVVINTESRAVTEDESRRAVLDVLRRFPPEVIVAKRFDTTLRGHLGIELAAVLEARPQACAVVVPSYPASGRLCIGGYQLMHGVPIERTEVADDPRWPLTDSYVPAYFAVAGPVTHISLSDVNAGQHNVEGLLQNAAVPGAVVVVDAFSDGDIAMIARATLSVQTEIVFAGPGVFLGSALGMRYRATSHHVVVVANGSTTRQTREQVTALEQKYSVRYLDLSLEGIAAGTSGREVADFLSTWDVQNTDVLVVRPVQERAERSLQPRIVAAIAEAIAETIEHGLPGIAGLILSGGETATGVLNRLGTHSIRPEVEFGSLVMGGVMLDGLLKGTKIVTKGGLVGDQAIFIKSLTWFLKENER
jgi:D-threonate/D-erythronate kinase